MFFSGTLMVLFLVVGFIAGWHVNDIVYSLINKNNPQIHPEMLDEDGFIINEELAYLRINKVYDEDLDFEDYDD